MAWHLMNAFSDGDRIFVDVCAQEVPLFPFADGSPTDPSRASQYLTRWKFDWAKPGIFATEKLKRHAMRVSAYRRAPHGPDLSARLRRVHRRPGQRRYFSSRHRTLRSRDQADASLLSRPAMRGGGARLCSEARQFKRGRRIFADQHLRRRSQRESSRDIRRGAT